MPGLKIKSIGRFLAVCLLFLFHLCHRAASAELFLSPETVRWIGEKVFQNECSDKDTCLIEWNEGEDFLSLGIGHFIWYPAGKKGPFDESFIGLLGHLKASGCAVPAWLEKRPPCPWATREDFLRDAGSPRVAELRAFLLKTKSEQVAFLVKQLDGALPKIVMGLPEAEREKVEKRFSLLARTPEGVYALVDYLNFKGLGISLSERYHGKGWGLSQVLRQMDEGEIGQEGVRAAFAAAAEKVLEERVRHAPAERNEERWLPGWQNRVRSYATASQEPEKAGGTPKRK